MRTGSLPARCALGGFLSTLLFQALGGLLLVFFLPFHTFAHGALLDMSGWVLGVNLSQPRGVALARGLEAEGPEIPRQLGVPGIGIGQPEVAGHAPLIAIGVAQQQALAGVVIAHGH